MAITDEIASLLLGELDVLTRMIESTSKRLDTHLEKIGNITDSVGGLSQKSSLDRDSQDLRLKQVSQHLTKIQNSLDKIGSQDSLENSAIKISHVEYLIESALGRIDSRRKSEYELVQWLAIGSISFVSGIFINSMLGPNSNTVCWISTIAISVMCVIFLRAKSMKKNDQMSEAEVNLAAAEARQVLINKWTT